MKQNVLGLQISVNETHQVQVFQSRGNLSSIKSRRVLVNALVGSGLESAEKFSTAAVFHAEVEVVFGLERVV
jgi:hypothetical protein